MPCGMCHICICSPNPWALFSGLRVSCWMWPLASWAPRVFGDQALPCSEFIVIVSSTSCCWAMIVVQVTVCSVSFRLLLLEFDILELRLQLIHCSLRYLGVECLNFRGISYRPMFEGENDLPYIVFDTGMVDGFRGAVNRWLLPWAVFSSVLCYNDWIQCVTMSKN